METLYHLIHSLAKEEKRLYNLHGRRGRFTAIYEAYADAKQYSRELDKEIFAKNFVNLSRAFFSMQKTELMQDLLAVLLEYSNSSDPRFKISRLRSKAEVLKYKSFFDSAMILLREAYQTANALQDESEIIRILEDILDIYPETQTAEWSDYQEILSSYRAVKEKKNEPGGLATDLRVLIKTAEKHPSEKDTYNEEASKVLALLDADATSNPGPRSWFSLFDSQLAYGTAFESPEDFHKRLIGLEKRFNTDQFPSLLRMRSILSLVESAMSVGDFLLMNALIYKTRSLVRSFPQNEKDLYLPRYLELAGIFHFYENELPTAMEEFKEILAFSTLSSVPRMRAYRHLAAAEHAANLNRQARATLLKLTNEFPEALNSIPMKTLELMISIELDDRETALTSCQKFRTFLRKQPNPRLLLAVRAFGEMVKKMLEKKNIKLQPMPGLDPGWEELYRPSLWLKAKTEGSFYYNYLLNFWQARKRVMK